MFFSWTARIVAVLMLVVLVPSLLAAFALAFGYMGDPSPENIKRYLGNYRTTGEAIDRRTALIFYAIILGILSEISFNIRRRSDNAT